ncbi:hypothetical protein HZH66_014071 [Vespula vulgaris]|uniref:Uncharacterized protein n=1 Tax=Vespula vulgaris TaxID=7454 RepID=A0A834MQK4_VESVU|nr:hypothetical protein HZH66_014071 [Vespula vulgaris]
MEEWGYSPTNSNCEVGILGYEREQQRQAFDRLLQLLVQLCYGLRRENLENFAEAIPANFNFALSEDFENQSPRWDLEIFGDAIRASMNEELIETYNSLFDIRLNAKWGYSPSRDDNKTDFALSGDFENLSSRVDLEIFTLPENFENLSPEWT